MTIATNLNQISEVLKENSIELIEFSNITRYSNFLSQHFFDEFKAEWINQSLWFGDRQTDYIVFFASEEIKNAPFYKKSHLVKMTKQSLYDLCEQYEILNYYYSEYCFEDNTKQMLIDELMKYVDNEKYYTHHFNESNYRYLDYDFSIVGYSQGDKVLIKKVGTEKQFINNDKSCNVDGEVLTNLFYDSPLDVSITIQVNGEEVETIDFFNGEYECYDKDKVIGMIESQYKDHKYYSQLLEYAKVELPNDAEYNY